MQSSHTDALILVTLFVALIALSRTRWVRLHDTDAPLSSVAIAIRVAATGVLSGAAALALLLASTQAAVVLPLPESWEWLQPTEILAAVGMLVLIRFIDGEVDRNWMVVGASLAATVAWFGSQWMDDFGFRLSRGTVEVGFGAAFLCVLMLSPGATTRLVARMRRIASGTDQTHVLLVDDSGHIRHLSASARSLLGIGSARPKAPWSREPVPPTLRSILAEPTSDVVRLRTASGKIVEARPVEIGRRRGFGRTRALLLRDVTDGHKDERRLVRLAHYDSLTGLANRRLFLHSLKKALEAATANTSQVALFYVDLDDFKAINDSLGHAVGDSLLKALAERFRSHLRVEDVARLGVATDARVTVARLAGDEFAVIVSEIGGNEAAATLARAIIDLIRKPLVLTDRTLNASASIGVALFPEHGRDVETLLRHADSALYVAKSRGRQRFAWYDPAFEARTDRVQLVEQGLRTALDRHEMHLYYQPKVDTRSGRLVGFEALLRWKCHDLGDIGPSEFIPVAESHGLITAFGSWCLDEACRQLRSWVDAGLHVVPVSVNVSSVQFTDSDLQREVSEALKRHGVEPCLLELELTESLLLDRRSNVEQILRDLRAIGVRIALDDFGTGYSALTYLNRFSLDVLKIDRDLLRDIHTDPSALGIANAVVVMAHSLGLTVVAEGVDMDDQLPILREMECDQIQGFLFSPALPADEVTRYMDKAGEERLVFGPGMSAPGRRPARQDSADAGVDEPVLRNAPETDLEGQPRTAPKAEKGRVLVIDDAGGSLGPVAMRLTHLGFDIHYVSEIDEAHLLVKQEQSTIRLVAIPPTIDADQARGVLDQLTRLSGEERCCIVIGDRPDEDVRRELRDSKVAWALWSPYTDSELRCVVRSAMTLREDLIDRREVRVPVDLVANIRINDRREVAVVSSLSPRGAFIELSEPFELGSQLRLELDLGTDRLRTFARVVHVQMDDPDSPSEPSGVGVSFYGADRDELRMLRKAVGEMQARYLP